MPKMRKRWVTVLLAATLCLTGCAVVPPATEQVLSYHSDITLQQDGALTVRELVRVRATGKVIRRGISQEFPQAQTDQAFALGQVLRDGEPAPYFLRKSGDGFILYVGQENAPLPPGTYTYTITFRTSQGLDVVNGMNVLHWAVTGETWPLPIDAATATVVLPESIPRESLLIEAFTGRGAGRREDVEFHIDTRGRVQFRARRGLGIREGMTVIISWPSDGGPF